MVSSVHVYPLLPFPSTCHMPRPTHSSLFYQQPKYKQINILVHKDGDAAPMSYVESSQFRKTSSQEEFTRVEIFPGATKFAGKPTVSDGPKAQVNNTSKTEKFAANQKTSEMNQSTTTEDTPDKSGYETPSASSVSLLSDELTDSFGKLPSSEEYDRNSRFTHSILYGFNTDF